MVKVHRQYLKILLSLITIVKQDKTNSIGTSYRLKYQKRYCENQKLNDKTRIILSKFFGSTWANEYIQNVLFEC